MADYQVWLVQPPGQVQQVIPEMKETPKEPVPDPGKVTEVTDEEFEILVPNIKYRKDALTCMNALKMEYEVGQVLKLIEKKDSGKFAIRDWVACEKPKVEFDPAAAAREAAAAEPASSGPNGTALTVVPPPHYPPNTKKKRSTK